MRQASPGTVYSYSVDVTCLIGVSDQKVVSEDVMVVRRYISALVDVVMKKGLRSSHTVYVL